MSLELMKSENSIQRNNVQIDHYEMTVQASQSLQQISLADHNYDSFR